MSEGIKDRLAKLLSEAASIVEEMEDCGEMVAAQKIKPGDKVRLKDEFKCHTGYSGLTKDGACGLCGVHGDDVLKISSVVEDGTKARFEHEARPWCPVSWIEKVEETFGRGDKVRIKDEFKEYAGKGVGESGCRCGLRGVSSDDDLEIRAISDDGTIAHFTHTADPWCPVSWLEKVDVGAEETLNPGDKVRLKPEFRKNAGKSVIYDDLPCGLRGVGENEVLTVVTTIGANAHFTKHFAWCPVSWLENVYDVEELPEAFAADGLPIKKGDELWFVDDGCYEKNGVEGSVKQPFRVVRIGNGIVGANGADENDDIYYWSIKPEHLTHAQPDTWERLEDDARKRDIDYWGCRGLTCDQCPADFPRDRHNTESCFTAVKIDIILRAKAIADRERGER